MILDPEEWFETVQFGYRWHVRLRAFSRPLTAQSGNVILAEIEDVEIRKYHWKTWMAVPMGDWVVKSG